MIRLRKTKDSTSKSVPNRYKYRPPVTDSDISQGRNKNGKIINQNVMKVIDWGKVTTSLLFIIIIGLIFYTITLSNSPNIEIVSTNYSNTFIQPVNIYKNALKHILSSSVSNDTKLTINTDAISNEITKQFPEIYKAAVVVPLVSHTLVVELIPTQAVCVIQANKSNYVIDVRGIVIGTISNKLEQIKGLPILKNNNNLSLNLGQQVLSTSSTNFINTLVDEFKAKNIQLTDLSLSSQPFELDAYVKGEQYYIKFNLLGNARLEAGTYFAAFNHLSSTNSLPSKYIDVRVAGRAYYE